jgi:hypothetical protein
VAVVDLAQMQHVPLHRPTAQNPAVLDDAPVAMLLAVLPANLVAQETCREIPPATERAASHLVGTADDLRASGDARAKPIKRLTRRRTAKFADCWASCESRVNAMVQLVGGGLLS